MTCVICKTGEANDGSTTVTLAKNDSVVIVKGVPAAVCDNCGEYYLAQDVAERVYALGQDAVRRKAEVEILSYVAA